MKQADTEDYITDPAFPTRRSWEFPGWESRNNSSRYTDQPEKLRKAPEHGAGAVGFSLTLQEEL